MRRVSRIISALALSTACAALAACGDASLGSNPSPGEGECEGGTDPQSFFGDGDGDGFGNPDISVTQCEAPDGFVANAGDCNDLIEEINPGARDLCGDDIDNDCAGGDLCQSRLLAQWLFDEGAGATAVDATGNGHDGTLQNGAAFVAGEAAVRFDGTDGVDDYVEVPHSDDFLLDEGTVSLWFRAPAIPPDPANPADLGLWSKDSSGFDTGGHLSLRLLASGGAEMRLQSTVDSVTIQSSDPISAGAWHHLVATYGPAGVHLYVDGAEVASDPYAGGTGTTSGGAGNFEPLAIGCLTVTSDDGAVTPTTDPLTGDLADVRVYSIALGAEDVADLFQLTAP